MQKLSYDDFTDRLQALNPRKPFYGQIELTYRCNLNCIHCYSKGIDERNDDKELSFSELKNIIDIIHKEGCLWLCLTGGEPLLREDFLDIYIYAYRKGLLIYVFTNGTLINKKIIRHFLRYKPFLIEITLNGIRQETYESITGVPGSFNKAMAAIDEVVKNRLPLVLKTNGLKQNRDEVLKIKSFTERLLGKGRFKFDSFIFPRLDGNLIPCRHRLDPKEIISIENKDADMLKQRQESSHRPLNIKRDKIFLYHCNTWMNQFFINPYGRLKFCYLSDDFSVDLRNASFKKGFYETFPKLLDQRYNSASKCKDCKLRFICLHCPARTFLEAGSYEGPVEYFCQLARMRAGQRMALLKE